MRTTDSDLDDEHCLIWSMLDVRINTDFSERQWHPCLCSGRFDTCRVTEYGRNKKGSQGTCVDVLMS